MAGADQSAGRPVPLDAPNSDRTERAVLERADGQLHVLHDDALGDETPDNGSNARNIEQLVNLELGGLLLQFLGLLGLQSYRTTTISRSVPFFDQMNGNLRISPAIWSNV